jgi:hypothetical protein
MENETENKGRECWSCSQYIAYYTKGVKQFKKEKYGECRQHKRRTTNHDTCDMWCMDNFRRKRRKAVSLIVLDELATDVSEIAQILREEAEDSKILPLIPNY